MSKIRDLAVSTLVFDQYVRDGILDPVPPPECNQASGCRQPSNKPQCNPPSPPPKHAANALGLPADAIMQLRSQLQHRLGAPMHA